MSEEKNNRDRWIHLRLTASEYRKIHTGFSASTKRKISEYARSILLEEPITVYSRDASLDDLVKELAKLRGELSAIGNNFNQTVKKLHLMSHSTEVKAWVIVNEKNKEVFFQKVAQIQEKIDQISKQWLPG